MSAPTEAEIQDMLDQLESISESLLGIVADVDCAHQTTLNLKGNLFPDTAPEQNDG